MKTEVKEEIEVPEGVTCNYENNVLTCKKESNEIKRKINRPDIEITVNDGKVIVLARKGNRKQYKVIKTLISHLRNSFSGLDKPLIYKLESASVHFPMTLKVEGDYVIINNFLGEKVSRKAKIVPGAEVNIDGQQITVSSYDKEAAGQTAANLEQATKVSKRDLRVFQDGIYITKKPAFETEDNAEEASE